MGYIFSLTCAAFWAIALVMLKSIAELPAIRANMAKNTLALACLIPTFWLIEGRLFPTADSKSFGILVISGIIGIGVADALVLLALKRLPAGLVSLLECAYSPFVLILSLAFLEERLEFWQMVGGSLIVFGSLIAAARGWQYQVPKILTGIAIMVLAIFMMAVGIVMVKPLYEATGFWDIVVIRMLAGCLGSFVIYAFYREPERLASVLISTRQKVLFWLACFSASYLAFVFWLAGYKYIDASLSSALNQTSTIFTLIFAAFFLNERLTKQGYIAVGIAGIGVGLLAFGKLAL